MKPWREVLAERGWEPFGTGDSREMWRCPNDPERWWYVHMTRLRTGRRTAAVFINSSTCAELHVEDLLDESTDTEDAAFAALMAKPIGPGRVTVGVLLGVSV